MQLGLILALLFTYGILELQFEKKPLSIFERVDPDPDVFIMPNVPDLIKIKRKKPIQIIKPKVKEPSIDVFKKEKDNIELTTTILKPKEPAEDNLGDAIEKLPNITEPTEDVPQPFILIEQAPIFPGCEGLDKKASKACFTKEISKFVNKKFDPGIAEELGLMGKQKIYVQFIINTEGNVSNIITNASYKGLEKEAKRVINKLPKMTPGMQRKRPVSVKYMLPISFEIQ